MVTPEMRRECSPRLRRQLRLKGRAAGAAAKLRGKKYSITYKSGVQGCGV